MSTKALRPILWVATLLSCATALAAQESAGEGSSEEFQLEIIDAGDRAPESGAAEPGSDSEAQEAPGPLGLSLAGATEIGGTFRFTASSAWSYEGLGETEEPVEPDNALTLDLGARLFLDARPSERFRVFGKLDLSSPFSESDGERSFSDVFHVRELFSDFQLGESLFLRAGKQTMAWGVGRFFSPADLLSVTAIDPEDPEAEREGPIALKAQLPLGAHNLYLYGVFEDAQELQDVALAPKVELVLGAAEVGLGGFYQREKAPAAMATGTLNLGDFHLFAEGVLSWGSNRTFVVEDSTTASGLTTTTETDGLYPSATAGFRWSHDDPADRFLLSLSAQYLYNGEGYADDILARSSTAVGALVAQGTLTTSDVLRSGRHYGAASLSWPDMLGSELTPALLWLGNLSDGSGRLTGSLAWSPTDEWGLTVKAGWRYGPSGSEYAPNGEALTLTVTTSLGGGEF